MAEWKVDGLRGRRMVTTKEDEGRTEEGEKKSRVTDASPPVVSPRLLPAIGKKEVAKMAVD